MRVDDTTSRGQITRAVGNQPRIYVMIAVKYIVGTTPRA
jgi:hypothetical protein